MNVTVNEVDQHKVTLHIEVPAKDASKQAAAACKNLASRVNIPGFRKGKAPRMVLESFLGKDAVKQEVFEAIANKAYSDALDQEGIVPVTEPELNVITDEKGKDVVFEATVTKKPEVKLGEYKGITVAKDKVDVTDEDVSKELVNLQKQHAKLVVAPEGTEIAKDDFAVIDFKALSTASHSKAAKANPIRSRLAPAASSLALKISSSAAKLATKKTSKSPSRKITLKNPWLAKKLSSPLKSTT